MRNFKKIYDKSIPAQETHVLNDPYTIFFPPLRNFLRAIQFLSYNDQGFCFALNSSLRELLEKHYGVSRSQRTIRRYRKKLVDMGYARKIHSGFYTQYFLVPTTVRERLDILAGWKAPVIHLVHYIANRRARISAKIDGRRNKNQLSLFKSGEMTEKEKDYQFLVRKLHAESKKQKEKLSRLYGADQNKIEAYFKLWFEKQMDILQKYLDGKYPSSNAPP